MPLPGVHGWTRKYLGDVKGIDSMLVAGEHWTSLSLKIFSLSGLTKLLVGFMVCFH